jgi:hypothetical protein
MTNKLCGLGLPLGQGHHFSLQRSAHWACSPHRRHSSWFQIRSGNGRKQVSSRKCTRGTVESQRPNMKLKLALLAKRLRA